MAEGAVFLLFALFALGAPLALYALVHGEDRPTEELTRAEAERRARRDTDGTDDGSEDEAWGSAARRDRN
ncbi:hypothetical protein [Halosegnis marinus]|uniref:Uncharacterized protein n=1 Tax=Halosegnis marinus TaxID=3034023 RepID=A0ABD5ZSN5_9EURY|nr:hypothetical protein [Halosegnis sp. DT85]